MCYDSKSLKSQFRFVTVMCILFNFLSILLFLFYVFFCLVYLLLYSTVNFLSSLNIIRILFSKFLWCWFSVLACVANSNASGLVWFNCAIVGSASSAPSMCHYRLSVVFFGALRVLMVSVLSCTYKRAAQFCRCISEPLSVCSFPVIQ